MKVTFSCGGKRRKQQRLFSCRLECQVPTVRPLAVPQSPGQNCSSHCWGMVGPVFLFTVSLQGPLGLTTPFSHHCRAPQGYYHVIYSLLSLIGILNTSTLVKWRLFLWKKSRSQSLKVKRFFLQCFNVFFSSREMYITRLSFRGIGLSQWQVFCQSHTKPNTTLKRYH